MFSKPIPIFKLLGFEVRIDPSWLILACLIVWTLARGYFPYQYPELYPGDWWWMAITGSAGLFLSIIIHEFAHSLVARRDGQNIKGITLFVFGGVAEMESEPPNAAAEFRMAIAGPLTSVALSLVLYAAAFAAQALQWGLPAVGVLGYLAFINAALAVFNLVPAFPLDGGRVLRAYLWKRWGDLRAATRTTSYLGSALGVGLIVVGVLNVFMGNFLGGMWWFLLGMFVRNASQASYRQLEIRTAFQGEPIARFMRKDPITVPPSITLQDLVDQYFYRHYHDMFPVVDGSTIVGCITTHDLKKVPRDEWTRRTAGEAASLCTANNTVPPEMDAVEALGIMTKTRNGRLLVAKDGQLLGLITFKDLLNFVALKLDLEGGGETARELKQMAASR